MYLQQVQQLWIEGSWSDLCEMDTEEAQSHPQAHALLPLLASAHFQNNHPIRGVELIQMAINNGCAISEARAVLMASVHNNVGIAQALLGNVNSVLPHFKQAIDLHAGNSTNHLCNQRLVTQLNGVQQKTGVRWSEPVDQLVQKANWRLADTVNQGAAAEIPLQILEQVQRCIGAADIHAAVDTLRNDYLPRLKSEDRLSFYMALSDALVQTKKDKMTALSYVQYAKKQMSFWSGTSATAVASRLVGLGQAELAAELITEMAVKGIGPILLSTQERAAVDKANADLHLAAGKKSEHGHDLLLSALPQHLASYKSTVAPRQPVLVEIGTTREDVPGQGSTRKIALFCKQHGLGFVTVDMDPHNSLLAREMFQQIGTPQFEAITAKGEDYLRQQSGPLDFVFLDAYDFDHGKHSEIRQSRYQQFLGSRIDEQQCHQMHLDCAQSVLAKLTPNGLVCVDDTWLENGQWVAKGTLAMPYLLSHQFDLLEARNRAALLGRSKAKAT
jgi:hypothetical protein